MRSTVRQGPRTVLSQRQPMRQITACTGKSVHGQSLLVCKEKTPPHHEIQIHGIPLTRKKDQKNPA
jgi:hypothetical protein